MVRIPGYLLPLGLLLLLFAPASVVSADETPLSFEQDVRPILKAHCFECHGEGEELAGGLDLRLRRFLVQGGDSGPALAPGKPEASPLLDRVRDGEMPPEGKPLEPGQLATLARWIDHGAATLHDEPEQLPPGLQFTAGDLSFWAFQPVVRPAVPELSAQAPEKSTAQASTQTSTQSSISPPAPIDAFLLARLKQHDLGFSPPADKLTLLRRACFDLLGLPPTPQQIELFLSDDAPDAYERLIDRLLASPRYGERWGRHWLDVAGYADSEGYSNDDPQRTWAYQYRDYVIRAFNADKPLDVFIQEQLAGDEMVAPPYDNLAPEEIEKLVATGYLRMAPDGTGAGGIDQPVARNQVVADVIQVVSTSLMGLTVGCAQCHNHRYDPISQADYYRMRAIFEPAYDWKQWRNPRQRLVSLYTDQDRQQAAAIEEQAKAIDARRNEKQQEYIQRTFESELAKLEEPLREPLRAARDTPAEKRTPEQAKMLKEHPSVNVSAGSLYLYDRKAADDLKQIADEAARLRATKPPEQFVRALTEQPGQIPTTFLFDRGDHEQPKQALKPRGLSILDAVAGENSLAEVCDNDGQLPTTGRRLSFARRLTDGRHPLTARVLVNQVWQHHFGRGLVASPGDFGALGDRPSHPQLLDWLACELVEGDWRLKRLHKMIMTSDAYRQSTQRREQLEVIDPDNRLLGRMNVRRLEAEAVRDAILSVSGRLNSQMFGPAVPVMEDDVGQFVLGIENKNGEGRPGEAIPLNGQQFRRSVYVQMRRSRPLGVLDTFDAPAMEPNCALRNASTVAPQSLMLMNSAFVVEMAEQFATRVQQEAGQEDTATQIRLAWRLAYGAEPDDDQLAGATQFLKQQAGHDAEVAATAQSGDQPGTSSTGETAGTENNANAGDTAKAENQKAENQEEGAETPVPVNPEAVHQALWSLCHALMSSNEFLYVD
jgi:hypothetical protein